MTAWASDELAKIDAADELYRSKYRRCATSIVGHKARVASLTLVPHS